MRVRVSPGPLKALDLLKHTGVISAAKVACSRITANPARTASNVKGRHSLFTFLGDVVSPAALDAISGPLDWHANYRQRAACHAAIHAKPDDARP